MVTSKCEIGRTVPKPILDLIEHYRGDFDRCIDNQIASKDHNGTVSYIAKVTAPCIDLCGAHVDFPLYRGGLRDMLVGRFLGRPPEGKDLNGPCGLHYPGG